MEKDFKKLKFDLLVYRHIYLIYAIIIALLICALPNTHAVWCITLESAIIFYLAYVLIFRLKNERTEIKIRSDIFLLTLTSLKKSLRSRIANLLVLENEFDVLKEKKNGLELIKDRIAQIQISTIEDSINTAIELGGASPGPFMASFSVPGTIPELHQLIKDMKEGAEKDREDITIMFDKINELAKKF